MKLISTRQDTKNNPVLIGPFSLVHFLSGVMAYLLIIDYFKFSVKNGFLVWFIIHGIYEANDCYNSYNINKDKDHVNSCYNSTADQIFGMLGYLFASTLSDVNLKILSVYYWIIFGLFAKLKYS
jgi:hypothetical protein